MVQPRVRDCSNGQGLSLSRASSSSAPFHTGSAVLMKKSRTSSCGSEADARFCGLWGAQARPAPSDDPGGGLMGRCPQAGAAAFSTSVSAGRSAKPSALRMPAHHSSAACCASASSCLASAAGMQVRAKYSGEMNSGRISSNPSTDQCGRSPPARPPAAAAAPAPPAARPAAPETGCRPGSRCRRRRSCRRGG